jgi:hypothetical protein
VHTNLVDRQALLVVPSEGNVFACLMPIDNHFNIEAVGLIHPIGCWPHARWPVVHSYSGGAWLGLTGAMAPPAKKVSVDYHQIFRTI